MSDIRCKPGHPFSRPRCPLATKANFAPPRLGGAEEIPASHGPHRWLPPLCVPPSDQILLPRPEFRVVDCGERQHRRLALRAVRQCPRRQFCRRAVRRARRFVQGSHKNEYGCHCTTPTALHTGVCHQEGDPILREADCGHSLWGDEGVACQEGQRTYRRHRSVLLYEVARDDGLRRRSGGPAKASTTKTREAHHSVSTIAVRKVTNSRQRRLP
jgi:hypothetical protein